MPACYCAYENGDWHDGVVLKARDKQYKDYPMCRYLICVIMLCVLAGCAAPATSVPSKPLTPQPLNQIVTSPVPIPTEVILSFSDTTEIEGWIISLGRFESSAQLHGADGVLYRPAGAYWLVWLDARNTGVGTRSLFGDFTFMTVDSSRDTQRDLSPTHAEPIANISRYYERAPLTEGVRPQALTHSLLVFDLQSNRNPQQLLLTRTTAAQEQVRYNLVPLLETALANATITTRAQVTAEAVSAHATAVIANKISTAETIAANKTATAESNRPATRKCGAICNDNTTSDSTGKGTCSHHGGVARWMYCP